jgi:serine/threonine protein kinase
MEAAISSALSHPNILQTYTYDIRPLRDNAGPGAQKMVMGMSSALGPASGSSGALGTSDGGGAVHSFEVRLVLEYCDKGSLREALDKGAFKAGRGDGGDEGVAAAAPAAAAPAVNYPAVLDTAVEIATAMVHLHGRNVLHADLKARNIMLKSNGAEGRGVSSKVADFGLSVKMDTTETHMSNTFQGTMSHMAPEILMKGRLSKAGDVYAFGILLWELLTAAYPFRDVPKALLGHHITKLHKRPDFPAGAPRGYVALATQCWDPKPSRR